MKLMEYTVRDLFARYGIAVPKGFVTDSAEAAAGANLRYPVAVKAQIPAGGRGKAGGIRFAQDGAEAAAHARSLLGSSLLGYPVNRLLIAEKCDHEAEWYLSVVLDRREKKPTLIFSPLGGMEIEQAARECPEQVVRATIDPMIGAREYLARFLVSKCGLDMHLVEPLDALIGALYRCFMENDCLLCEINPLALGAGGRLLALDGKAEIDDSALARHPEFAALSDAAQEEPLARAARERGFLYIPIQSGGSVAVCSNGSGMLMSCIDMIAREGLGVAAALDLGGGATAERIAGALGILLATPGVRAALINIFGGITRCDEVANGIALCLRGGGMEGKTVVVRMEGTNKQLGCDILRELPDNVVRADGLLESIGVLLERRALL